MELELSKAEIKANEMLNEIEKEEKIVEVNTQDVALENELPKQEASNTKEFTNVVYNVLDKGVNYAIKALPIADGLKDVALDVKEALKTNDFKHIVKTAIGSSIREGLEMLSAPINVLRDIKNIKDIALKGGLTKAINAGIDIVYNKYLKNNIFSNIAKDVISTVKNFVNSKEFVTKIENAFDKIGEKVNKFKSICNSWHEAYEKFDIEKINDVAKIINKQSRNVLDNAECITENKLIQNITAMINNTKEKLSTIQMDACKIV